MIEVSLSTILTRLRRAGFNVRRVRSAAERAAFPGAEWFVVHADGVPEPCDLEVLGQRVLKPFESFGRPLRRVVRDDAGKVTGAKPVPGAADTIERLANLQCPAPAGEVKLPDTAAAQPLPLAVPNTTTAGTSDKGSAPPDARPAPLDAPDDDDALRRAEALLRSIKAGGTP